MAVDFKGKLVLGRFTPLGTVDVHFQPVGVEALPPKTSA